MMPAAGDVVPCRSTLVAVGFSPLVVKTRLSDERYSPPETERLAPPVAAELSQPRSAPEGGFEQGHPATPPTPGSQRLVNGGCARSRTKMSYQPPVSPGTRFEASLMNTTKRSSADILPPALSALPGAPARSTLMHSVVPFWRSR